MTVLPRVGDQLAGYKLLAITGRGGMSAIYQAENVRFGSIVALKVISPELAADGTFRTQFLAESRIAACLNHPNIIPIYDMGIHEDLLFIAMRFVTGSDLRAVLTEQRFLSPAHALSLIGQAGRALDAAHRQGLVHRDVNPGKILVEYGTDVDEPDHVYLTGFGISRQGVPPGGPRDATGFPGAIDYLAPEQIQGRAVDGRADVYSLGCVLYECLTGRAPFVNGLDAAVLHAHLEERPTPPGALQPALPRGFDDVLARALAKEPGDRYPTCHDLIRAARRALGGIGEPVGTVERAASPVTGQRNLPVPAQRSLPGQRMPGGRPPHAGGGHRAADPAGAPRPPGRRRLRVVIGTVSALVLAAAAGAGGWAFAHGGSGKPAMPANAAMSHPASNGLLHMLAMTNESRTARGKLPPHSCHAQGTSAVTCDNPAFAVTTVTFRTYPSRKALYDAYLARVESLGDKPFRQDYGNCMQDQTSGEVGWNHDYLHPKKYSVQDMRSGMISDDQAAGRVFCTFTGSDYHIVWTQDDGRLLADLTGAPHKDAWYWWRGVHHSIVPPGSKRMHM